MVKKPAGEPIAKVKLGIRQLELTLVPEDQGDEMRGSLYLRIGRPEKEDEVYFIATLRRAGIKGLIGSLHTLLERLPDNRAGAEAKAKPPRTPYAGPSDVPRAPGCPAGRASPL
jgi:hypothetical protein